MKHNHLPYAFILAFQSLVLCSGNAQSVFLDESTTDWTSGIPEYPDPEKDGNAGGIDFSACSLHHDDTYLFLLLHVGKEINIQDNNNLAVWVDTDNSVSTGLLRYGLGIDLVYYPGDRTGRIYTGGTSYTIFHDEAGWVTSPTVTSDVFEVSLRRKIEYNGRVLNLGNQIRLVVSDESVAGDRIPDNGASLNYIFSTSPVFKPKDFSLTKPADADIRVLSYNVLRDNLFSSSVQPSARRLFQAIQPDIIGFCEIYNHSPSETASLISGYLPPGVGKQWYAAGVTPDIIMVSLYPILQARAIDGNGAFLLDLGKVKMVAIVMHLPCCDNDVQRQQEADNIMAFVRAVRFGISSFPVPQNTPIVLLGDTNLVGLSRQQTTLITGDIADNVTYGVDIDPDWDETPLEDAIPVTTNAPFTFTWYNRQGSFSAGRLDYILYTGSVMRLTNSYSLWTEYLTPTQLAASGLQASDVERVSDHLPVVADFDVIGLSSDSGIDESGDNQENNIVIQAGTLHAHTGEGTIIDVLDLSGRLLFRHIARAGRYQVETGDRLSHSGPAILHVTDPGTGKSWSKIILLP